MAGGTRSYEMARRLVSYGHQVHVITSYRQGDGKNRNSWYQTEESGILVHWLPVPYSNRMSYTERIQAFIKFAWKAAAKAVSIDYDVVFATSTPLTIALPAVYASRKKKVPMVFEVRDLWPELPIAIGALKNPVTKNAAKWLEHFAYNNSKRIVALSPGMREGIIESGYPADRVEMIPNSCDIDFFDVNSESGKQLRQKYEWLQHRPLVTYTGTLGMINGVEYLVKIARAVWDLDSEVRFLVIGEGKGEEKVKEEAKTLGVLEKNFFMVPKIPKQDIPEWLSASDMATSLFVDLKEMWANSANKFFDALAAGKPIAINYKGWQADIIHETGVGLVLDPNDIEASAKMLVKKIRDKEWLDSTGAAAKKLGKERFNRDKLAKKLEETLFEAVEENSR